MERQLIIEAFKATTSANGQKEATEFLNQNSSMIGFTSLLLDIVSDETVELAVRQASGIFLKNHIRELWVLDADEVGKKLPIAEQDKVAIRQVIVAKIISAPEALKVQLCVCMQFILRHDFPEVWPGIVDELLRLFSSNEGAAWYTGLLITHRLAKIFEYKRQVDKKPFLETMARLLPVFYARFAAIIDDQSQEANVLQKLMLKIFYCFIQFSLSTDALTPESFGHWLALFVKIVERDIPTEVEQIDYEDRDETIWWKCKKWALKIIERVFERYGSKGHVEASYKEFAEYYTKNYLAPVVTSVLKVLERYIRKEYVTNRVMYLSICHVAEALSHGSIWKLVKPHLDVIFCDILFPLMQFTDVDQELWEEDPESYLREKQDCFEEVRSPASAAIRFLNAAAKRQGILLPILTQVITKLQNEECGPHDLDGSLHVIAALAPTLCEDRRYKKDVEKLIIQNVKPRITHPAKFVRARALTVIKEAAEAPFKDRMFLADLVETITQRLKDPNEELPVKFEAAIAIQSLVSNQPDNVAAFVKPRIGDLLREILRLLAQHNLEDLPAVIETLIEAYSDDVIPVAEIVVYELVQVFNQLAKADDGSALNENSMTIMGVLATLETILQLVHDSQEALDKIEPIVANTVAEILDAFAADFFEEAASLIDCLLTHRISPQMWVVYDKLLDAFEAEGSLFFTDSMPAFAKFVTKDPAAFMADPQRLLRMLVLIERVLNDEECGDDIHMYAVKMLEILLSHYKGHLDQVYPQIIALVMKKLLAEQTEFEDIHAQCCVTLIEALNYNQQLFIQLISQYEPHHANNFNWFFEYVYTHFANFNGIHDRSVLLYALFLAFKMDKAIRPSIVNTQPQKLMEVIIKLFEDIQKCKKLIHEADDDDSDDDDSDDDENEERDADLQDSDDDINENEQEYMLSLEKKMAADVSDSECSEERHSFVEATELEEFETPFDGENPAINVHTLFMDVMNDLESTDSPLYNQLLAIPEEKKTQLKDLIQLCHQEKEALRSRQLNSSGGYNFNNSADVPSNFAFQ
ncbi:unnamed protein product [Bursaphelenchus xylophilus]|uniref:(pine wood nematode) hypothetical protein n=1 Tax=Bursaphelenchus xylophilus TaxID=6326 RepID=A0A1I7RRB1_BURXY|nr:unnamed protein product [Bursaphelenchus xylophilus]CAG9130910.1 unnamed protein product [Bursaphelenchus xylophilus]